MTHSSPTSTGSARWPALPDRTPRGRFVPLRDQGGPPMRSIRRASLAALVIAATATASVAAATPASAAKSKKPAAITVLVTNDDGVSAPGIDTLVEALRK